MIKIEMICRNCSKKFQDYKSNKTGKNIFCSKYCFNKFQIGKRSWNKGIPHTKEHKINLRKAKEFDRKYGQPWKRNGSYYPCCSCYKKLIYLNQSQLIRGQKPYCSRECSPLKQYRGGDDKIIDTVLKKKMTLKEIYETFHCSKYKVKKILKRNNIGFSFQQRKKNRLSKLRIQDFKDGKFIFPLRDSSIEVKIQNYLKNLRIEFITHQYINIEHGYQCDIFVPSKNLIIECDGNYWHNYPEGRDIDHIRTEEIKEKGISLCRIWESEINKMSLKKFSSLVNKY